MDKEEFIELLMKQGFTTVTEENGIVMAKLNCGGKEAKASLKKISTLAEESEFHCSYGIKYKNDDTSENIPFNKEETREECKEEIEDYNFSMGDSLEGFGQLSFL